MQVVLLLQGTRKALTWFVLLECFYGNLWLHLVINVLSSNLPICCHQFTDPLKVSLFNTYMLFVLCSSDQTSLLEFLHILTTNHKLVFAPVNNEPDFIAGLCHWLLVMGTHKSLSVGDDNKKSEGDSLILLCKRVLLSLLPVSQSHSNSLMAQWWERSPPSNVDWARFRPNAVGRVCCWFSPYSEGFSPENPSGTPVFLPPQKQSRQIPISPE